MRKYIAIFTAVMTALTVFFARPLETKANVGSIDMGDVIQMGDFDGSTHYIVFYPKALETSDQAWPVAVWANGTMCPPALYISLLQGVAAKGYVVVASSEMMSADGKGQIEAIDYIFEESMDEESPLCGKIDPGRIAAFGHSQGGRSSVNAAAADERIRCIVSIAGSSYSSEASKLSTPALFLTGTADMIVLSSLWVKPAYNKAKGPAVYASLNGGVHTSCVLDADAYIDYCASWFDAWLGDNAEAMAQFKSGGKLSKDSAWKDYASKNMNTGTLAGSVFGGSSLWRGIALAELLVIAGAGAVILSKRKDRLQP